MAGFSGQTVIVTGAARGIGRAIAQRFATEGAGLALADMDGDGLSAVAAELEDEYNASVVTTVGDLSLDAVAAAVVDTARSTFGRIDVLVNNAGNFYAGFFEEISPEDFRAQLETTLLGPITVTRAVLPVLRTQRSGLVVTISSTAGLTGGEFLTAYAASKFGLEGWMESLAPEVAPFGIHTMLVEPGFFRTELLTPESTKYAESSIEDYAERTKQTVEAWNSMNGRQGGDPAKLADALISLASHEEPPRRFAAGADAVATFEQKAQELLDQAAAHRDLSSNLAHG
jgi:NAD(P)-dependent dehydrogenase (short-subunit alcohol dehydrogenase family)